MATIVGTNANDTIIGTNQDDTIRGLAGRDTIRGSAGNDLIRGGAGDDTLRGGSGNDTIIGGTGVNILYGDAGNDTLIGGPGFNNIYGGAGNDIIHTGNAGEYNGGGGNDRIFADDGIAMTLNGGTGVDWLDLTYTSDDYAVNMATGVTNFAQKSYVNFENISTGGGDDTVLGTAGDNVFNTGAGNDFVLGGDGNDTFIGGAGFDDLFGQDGIDTIDYRDFGTAITVNVEFGTVVSNGETATISGIENFVGTDFNDTFNTHDETHNVFKGRKGNDVFIKGVGTGGSSLDVFNGGAGTDLLIATAMLSSNVINLAKGYIFFGTGQRDRLVSIENVVANGDATVIGDDKDNSITVTGSNGHLVRGGKGDDLITALEGADRLLGGRGDDQITAGEGNDTINGGRGDDRMSGGAGSDTFIFKGQFGRDRIFDFDATDDNEKIDFSGVNGITGFADLMNNHADQIGANVVVSVGEYRLVLENVDINDLHAADFLF